ncbi:D-alanyl-D-alanine carboxypeptidase family protein [Salimicrobium halophilum]|uniref:D-alanyl-D-alanine carboxypeptidase n=1 Tax=Salimicrobium halophilum TaxID=86666 RepID=A0A1G8PY01_9BACI|nr:D-alanyl-D-alanine carboxypeptidase family protein [Salimicrobium halophilum]SDI97351.1 D-alanyl-D-alanine carboxypeptidase [Salimicrobium halophilum]
MGRNVFVLISMVILMLITNTTVSADPYVSAERAVLIDAGTGDVLYEKRAGERALIASTTKIMTGLIASEHGNLSDIVEVSVDAATTEGSSLYLEAGEKVPLEDLIHGLILRSGNDAAVAIAEHVGGSIPGFVYLMNEKKDWLGLTDTHFANPHGLDDPMHYSSALDLARLMRHVQTNETMEKVMEKTSYKSSIRDYPWRNKNKLLTTYYDPATGGKTGYTKAAGRTFVSSAEKDGVTLIAVTLNAPDDWEDHRMLYEYGFEKRKDASDSSFLDRILAVFEGVFSWST